MSHVTLSGASTALQIAALQVEVTNQQQEANKATREAAREAKIAEMEAEEQSLRDQAAALIQDAVIGGATRVGAGAAKFAAGTNQLEQSSHELDAAEMQQPNGTYANAEDHTAAMHSKQQALDVGYAARNATFVADGFEGAAHVSDVLSQARTKDLEADAAQHRRMAEQAQAIIDDQSDRIRRTEDQFAQKLGVLESTAKAARETELMIIRG